MSLTMKVFRAAVMFTTLIGPFALMGSAAHAQSNMPNVNLIPDLPSKTPEQIERDKQRDKAYRDSLRKIPDAKGSNDPWGGVRSGAAEPKGRGKTRRAN